VSLLDTRARYQPVIVFPEEMVVDEDGNKFTRPVPKYVTVIDDDTNEPVQVLNPKAIETIARFQIRNQSGTSARRAEQDNEGFETEKVYSMRFPRAFTREHGILGAQTQIEWRGERWAVFGDATVYDDSPKLSRVDYVIKRY